MVLNEKGIIKEFELVVYPINFIAVIGDMEKELNKNYAPNEEDGNWISGPPPGIAGRTYVIHDTDTNQLSVMIWIRDLNECKGFIFAHECSHAAMEIFNYIGATVDLENQEPFAYLTGNLFRLLNGVFYEFRDYKPQKKSKKKEELPKLHHSKF